MSQDTDAPTTCAVCGKVIPALPIGERSLCVSCRYDDAPAVKPWDHDAERRGDLAGSQIRRGKLPAWCQQQTAAAEFDFDAVCDRLDGMDHEQLRGVVAEEIRSQLEDARREGRREVLELTFDGATTMDTVARNATAIAYLHVYDYEPAKSVAGLAELWGVSPGRVSQFLNSIRPKLAEKLGISQKTLNRVPRV
jgi:hypothetical protein